ncbi:MAG TPA: phosphatidate cytidylyltransferase [Solirubrobacteraceae bacterium]|nr:phosphatidate cytidylyltransferase [Solirubrobacteraceae bacterium]
MAPRQQPAPRQQTRSELLDRVLVGGPALAGALALVAVGGVTFAVAMALLGVACLYELYQLYAEAKPVWLAGLAALLGLLAAAQWGTQEQVLLIAVAALPLTFVVALCTGRSSTSAIALTLLGVWWIALALAYAVLLRRLPHGGGIVLDVLVGTFVGDSAAYLGGRAIGRHKLASRISPNKTVEGLVLGFAFAVLAVFVASRFQHWLHVGDALALGAGVAVAAPLGDLFESFVKRDAGAKDTGRLFGAHGGALDRLDAVLFAAVTGFYIWHAILVS